MLDRLVEAVRAGQSRVLMLRGEPGMGKTVLLDYLVRRASGCRVARAAGVQSEMELAFAGLHQLCGPMLDRLDISVTDVLRWGWVTQAASTAMWDDDGWRAILARHLAVVRDAGALDRLPIYLAAMGTSSVWSGDFSAAASVIAEADAVGEATGTRIAPYGALMLAAFRGAEAEAAALIEETVNEASAGGQGIAVTFARWAEAILANGVGRYEEALAAAQQASEDTPELYVSMWALPSWSRPPHGAGTLSWAPKH